MASLLEEKGFTSGLDKEKKDLTAFILKAIALREKQIGEINMPNAISYCTMAKFMSIRGKITEAEKYLNKAIKIFSKFPSNHPNIWIPYLIKSLLDRDQNIAVEIESVKNSVNLV